MIKVTVNVTGMMCGHCEAHVNKAVEAAFGVQNVMSSHEAGTTVFTAPEKVDEAKLRQVITDAALSREMIVPRESFYLPVHLTESLFQTRFNVLFFIFLINFP